MQEPPGDESASAGADVAGAHQVSADHRSGEEGSHPCSQAGRAGPSSPRHPEACPPASRLQACACCQCSLDVLSTQSNGPAFEHKQATTAVLTRHTLEMMMLHLQRGLFQISDGMVVRHCWLLATISACATPQQLPYIYISLAAGDFGQSCQRCHNDLQWLLLPGWCCA